MIRATSWASTRDMCLKETLGWAKPETQTDNKRWGILGYIFQHPPLIRYSKDVNHPKFLNQGMMLRNVQPFSEDISNLIC